MTENTNPNTPEAARSQRRGTPAATGSAARKRRPHPAQQARRIAGLTSVAGMLVLTGCMAAGTTATNSTASGTTANTSTAGTATGATTATKSTSTATAATATTATTQAVTTSHGS